MSNSTVTDYIKISPQELHQEFYRILVKNEFPENKAKACAEIFTSNTVDGVYTHSVNRFPKFIQMVKQGYVKTDQDVVCKNKAGAVEQWDGQSGIGVLNALKCTERSIALASEFGLGCVALANTNHWMRGGAYGWKAARAGYAFIGWTNTNSNTPAWGAIDCKLGNNPLVMAVPFQQEAIVLDMAMSQFSYGTMDFYRMKGEKLPVPGGYDEEGNLTSDPSAILNTRRTLPAGYWKGTGLSLLLDILATILSGGLSVSAISKQPAETNMSQVFISIKLSDLNHQNKITELIRQIIDDYHNATPVKPSGSIRYPGERILQIRKENTTTGIPVLKNIWNEIKSL